MNHQHAAAFHGLEIAPPDRNHVLIGAKTAQSAKTRIAAKTAPLRLRCKRRAQAIENQALGAWARRGRAALADPTGKADLVDQTKQRRAWGVRQMHMLMAIDEIRRGAEDID